MCNENRRDDTVDCGISVLRIFLHRDSPTSQPLSIATGKDRADHISKQTDEDKGERKS